MPSLVRQRSSSQATPVESRVAIHQRLLAATFRDPPRWQALSSKSDGFPQASASSLERPPSLRTGSPHRRRQSDDARVGHKPNPSDRAALDPLKAGQDVRAGDGHSPKSPRQDPPRSPSPLASLHGSCRSLTSFRNASHGSISRSNSMFAHRARRQKAEEPSPATRRLVVIQAAIRTCVPSPTLPSFISQFPDRASLMPCWRSRYLSQRRVARLIDERAMRQWDRSARQIQGAARRKGKRHIATPSISLQVESSAVGLDMQDVQLDRKDVDSGIMAGATTATPTVKRGSSMAGDI